MLRTFLLGCALAASLIAQTATELSSDDKNFLDVANQTDLLLVRIARLAQLNAAAAPVKKFALELEHSHDADRRQLVVLARKVRSDIPDSLDAPHQADEKRLTKDRGHSFDHEFLRVVINRYESAIEVFKHQSASTANPALQAYAKRILPRLEKHLTEARALGPVAPKH